MSEAIENNRKTVTMCRQENGLKNTYVVNIIVWPLDSLKSSYPCVLPSKQYNGKVTSMVLNTIQK